MGGACCSSCCLVSADRAHACPVRGENTMKKEEEEEEEDFIFFFVGFEDEFVALTESQTLADPV